MPVTDQQPPLEDAPALCARGAVLARQGLFDAALASYDAALVLEPRDPVAHFQRGNVLRALGHSAAAVASYTQAIAVKSDFAEAWFNRGVLLHAGGQRQAALENYDQAVAINPGLFQAFYNRGNVLKELKAPTKALASYDQAIALKGNYPEAWSNRGVTLQELGRWDDALASYDRAIELKPDYPEAWFNRGTLQNELQQWDTAIASFNRAIAIRGDYAQSYCGRGTTQMELRQMDAAIASFDRAIALNSDFAEAHYNRAFALLLCGDYAAGWPEFEWRWKNADKLSMGEPRRFRQPLWHGEQSLQGRRILIWSEQGLGDTLQFCRYVKIVAGLGAEVIFEVQAPLLELAANLDGARQLVANGSALPDFDYQCPLTTLQTVPAATAYIRSDPAKVAYWRDQLDGRTRPRVGLVWSGNKNYGADARRSVRLAEWIAHLPRDLEYFCLQKDIRDADMQTLAANPWIGTCDDEFAGFAYTAALITELDLVISVDTSIAHLSAALGQRTWLLEGFNPDWRWMMEREDSPWYPTLRLYRQPRAGDWPTVFARVAADLQRELGQR
jgi:tetratricopeptide (TPR) repeat protein